MAAREPKERSLAVDSAGTSTLTQSKPLKQAAKLGAEKLTPEEQRRRFIDAAREAGASEDEAEFDAALKRIARPRNEAKP